MKEALKTILIIALLGILLSLFFAWITVWDAFAQEAFPWKTFPELSSNFTDLEVKCNGFVYSSHFKVDNVWYGAFWKSPRLVVAKFPNGPMAMPTWVWVATIALDGSIRVVTSTHEVASSPCEYFTEKNDGLVKDKALQT